MMLTPTGCLLLLWLQAGMDYAVNFEMGYWVARSWPPFRTFVFAMGCLAALNRVEVGRRQAQLDRDLAEGNQTSKELDGDRTAHAGHELGVDFLGCGNLWCSGTAAEQQSCCCRPSTGDPLPTVMWGALRAKDTAAWAQRVDRLVAAYCAVITTIVLIEKFVTFTGGRMWLEAMVPLVELAIIVGLTYDDRQSYTSRFCNWGPINW
jgi:hypothetical protein